jgi:hypothetical protein
MEKAAKSQTENAEEAIENPYGKIRSDEIQTFFTSSET